MLSVANDFFQTISQPRFPRGRAQLLLVLILRFPRASYTFSNLSCVPDRNLVAAGEKWPPLVGYSVTTKCKFHTLSLMAKALLHVRIGLPSSGAAAILGYTASESSHGPSLFNLWTAAESSGSPPLAPHFTIRLTYFHCSLYKPHILQDARE